MSLWAVPWKCVRLMSYCLNFNGFLLFDQPTDTMIERPTLSQLQVVALRRTTEKQVRLLESCFASSSCILWHTISIEFSCERDPQTCLCPPRTISTGSCLHLCNLALGHFRRHVQHVPVQSLHVWRSARDLLADIFR